VRNRGGIILHLAYSTGRTDYCGSSKRKTIAQDENDFEIFAGATVVGADTAGGGFDCQCPRCNFAGHVYIAEESVVLVALIRARGRRLIHRRIHYRRSSYLYYHVGRLGVALDLCGESIEGPTSRQACESCGA